MDAVSVFRRTAAREPRRIFAFDATAAITYAEADVQSDAIAFELARRGLSSGDPLGLYAPDSVGLLVATLGTWKAGVQPSLIDARTPEADLAYFVNNVGASLYATTPALYDRLRAAGARNIVDLGSLGTGGGTPPRLHGPDKPLYLSYTSGTTGRPKGAVLLSGPVTLGTVRIAERLNLTRQDIILATTPTSSSFQLVAATLPAMHVGATVGFTAGLTPDEIWSIARRWRATVLVGYPLTLADMVNAPYAESNSPLRLALSGGSPLAPRIKRDFRDRLSIPLVESYGQSELGGFMALGSPADGDLSLDGYVGQSLSDRPTYIVGASREELVAGQVGEVIVPHGFFAGYWNNPEATARTLSGGVLHTGDVGMRDADGRIKVLGRTGEAQAAAWRGGFLRELEDEYHEHPDVLHAAAVEFRPSEIVAFVELRNGRAVNGDQLTGFASSRVAKDLRPRSTTVLDRMPRTFSGKVDRRRLAQGFRA